MNSNPQVRKTRELYDLLGSLAKTRGFVMEHEIPEESPMEGGLETAVFNCSGQQCGKVSVPSEEQRRAKNILENFPPQQRSEHRDSLLQDLPEVEAQLFAWLVVVMLEEEEWTVTVAESISDKLTKFQEDRALWIAQLVLPENLPSLSKSSLRQILNDYEFERKERSQFTRTVFIDWCSSKTLLNLPAKISHDAVEFWGEKLGDIRAQLLEGNIRLVSTWAARFRYSLSVEDSIRLGFIGFSKALDRFEIDRGLQLSTYATLWIRQNLNRANKNHGKPIRLPVHIVERVSRLVEAYHRVWRPGIDAEQCLSLALADLDLSKSEALSLIEQTKNSLPANQNSPDRFCVVEEYLFDASSYTRRQIGPSGYIQKIRRTMELILNNLRDALTKKGKGKRLTSRSLDILERRWGLGRPEKSTLEEVAKPHNVTRELIRQNEVKLRNNIRHRDGAKIEKLLNEILRQIYE